CAPRRGGVALQQRHACTASRERICQGRAEHAASGDDDAIAALSRKSSKPKNCHSGEELQQSSSVHARPPMTCGLYASHLSTLEAMSTMTLKAVSRKAISQ